jgi:hypothetical protein
MGGLSEHDFGLVYWTGRVALVIAILVSAAVIATGLTFWPHLVKKKVHMKIVMMISAADAIASIFSLFMPSSGQHGLCDIQGFMWTFFFRLSWFYIVATPVILYGQVKYHRVIVTFQSLSLWIWGACLLISLLPVMASVSYGDSEPNGRRRCGLDYTSLGEGNENKIAFWLLAIVFIPCLACSAASITILLFLLYHFKANFPDTEVTERIKKLVFSIVYYPAGLIAFWTPFAATWVAVNLCQWQYDPVKNEFSETGVLVYRGTEAFAYCYGIYVGCVFFWKSGESRRRWRDLLRNYARTYIGVSAFSGGSDGGGNDNILNELGGGDGSLPAAGSSIGRESSIAPGNAIMMPQLERDFEEDIFEEEDAERPSQGQRSLSTASQWSELAVGGVGRAFRASLARSSSLTGLGLGLERDSATGVGGGTGGVGEEEERGGGRTASSASNDLRDILLVEEEASLDGTDNIPNPVVFRSF